MATVQESTGQAVREEGSRGLGDALAVAGVDRIQAWRAATTVVGGLLMAVSLKRRTLGGLVLGLVGGSLLRQGLKGEGTFLQLMGVTGPDGQGEVMSEAIELQRTVTILKTPEELYRLWRDPATPSQIMAGFAEVTVIDETYAHWVVPGPMGMSWEWDTRIIEDRPNQLVRWVSQSGAPLPHEGSVEFRPVPDGRPGAEVVLRLRYAVPGGPRALPLLRGIPKELSLKLLRNFRCLAEVGEVTIVKGQPTCRNGGRD